MINLTAKNDSGEFVKDFKEFNLELMRLIEMYTNAGFEVILNKE